MSRAHFLCVIVNEGAEEIYEVTKAEDEVDQDNY